ncbi:YppE family protein [Pullulanibacillus sp. KACC 23026]|uniref:YppE family protein n=1 Tax=Pullulanibacillus sp. KACC 23026 TaxID=3028315 RepID=UPI0023B0F89B|nr:YppE family protein [Pullulanibacillus sp. KACC 23026]WEG11322.1 YppE family protein [Pullulanibacillus sp. KACC 23026]
MNDQQLARLKAITEELRQIGRDCHDQFLNRTSAADYKVDFFGEVKPYAEHVTELLKEWQPLAMQWIREAKPRYIFVPQLLDADENLTIVSVTAFQKDTRKKRFLNTISAIEHTLTTMLDQLGS